MERFLISITLYFLFNLFLSSFSFSSNIVIMKMSTNLIYTSADENSHRIFRLRKQVLGLLLIRDILAVDLESERWGLFQWTMQPLLDFRNESLFSRERYTCIMKHSCSECKSGLETRWNLEYSWAESARISHSLQFTLATITQRQKQKSKFLHFKKTKISVQLKL